MATMLRNRTGCTAMTWKTIAMRAAAILTTVLAIEVRATAPAYSQGLSSTSPQAVCSRALGTGWMAWKEPYSAVTSEALRRGYSVNNCRVLLSCYNALNEGRTAWRTDPEYARDYEDLKQQRVSVSDCRQLIANAEGQTAITNPTEPSIREAVRAPEPLVVSIQTLLGALGYDVGPADGFAGSKTAAAISEFQQSIGEKPDGRSSEALRASLQKALAERGPGSAPKQPDKPRDGSKGDTKLVSTGTGFFIAGDIIITNNHVVEGCKEIRRPRPRRSTA